MLRLYRGPARRRNRSALVSYLVAPLLPPFRWVTRNQFSPHGMARAIPRALAEMGFEVDVLDFRNTRWVPRRRYDLFVGHGGFNFARLREAIGPEARNILFATGIYWREFNRRSVARCEALRARRGALLPPERLCEESEEDSCRASDGIICLGNDAAAGTYSEWPRVVPIDIAAYPTRLTVTRRDTDRARRSFLFFSGPGNLHKGLDRLIEGFEGSGLELHVCQRIAPGFGEVYRSELHNAANIHCHGLIAMRSRQFRELAQECAWIILPTCAEGQPGSVIECMLHGLVPILPEEANIDLEDFGVPLSDCEPATIGRVTAEAARMPITEVERRSALSARAARERYSVGRFASAFAAAVTRILADCDRGYLGG